MLASGTATQARIADLTRRDNDLGARKAAFEKEAQETGTLSRIVELNDRRSLRGTLLLLYALLGFWGSQFVAVALASWARKR